MFSQTSASVTTQFSAFQSLGQIVPGFCEFIPFVIQLVYSDVDPANKRKRISNPIFTVLNGRQRSHPKSDVLAGNRCPRKTVTNPGAGRPTLANR